MICGPGFMAYQGFSQKILPEDSAALCLINMFEAGNCEMQKFNFFRNYQESN